MSAVGFEPGTFRSLIEHSNHCSTQTQPIVLLNNVPITMTSYDTHTTRHLADTTIHAKSHHRVSPLASLTWERCELHQPALFAAITFPMSTPPRTLRRPSPISTVHLGHLPRPTAHLAHLLGFFHRNPYLLTWRIWRLLKNTYILLKG